VANFDPDQYGPVFAELVQGNRLRSLDAGSPEEAMRSRLETLSVDEAFDHAEIVGPEMARCCLSGVWLMHDFLDESHTISQGIATSSGSFWHGIMHRREGDFSNAKYWFRKVGSTVCCLSRRVSLAWQPTAHGILLGLSTLASWRSAGEALGSSPANGFSSWNGSCFLIPVILRQSRSGGHFMRRTIAKSFFEPPRSPRAPRKIAMEAEKYRDLAYLAVFF